MSRCTTPASWAYWSASHIWPTSASASRGDVSLARITRRRSVPSTSSIASQKWSPARPKSNTETMFGWLSWASARASWAKRSAKVGSPAAVAGSTLSATGRSRERCTARYTTPIPPRPIRSPISNWGASRASSSGSGGGSSTAGERVTTTSSLIPSAIRHVRQIPWRLPPGARVDPQRLQLRWLMARPALLFARGECGSGGSGGSTPSSRKRRAGLQRFPGDVLYPPERAPKSCRSSSSTSAGSGTVSATSARSFSPKRWRSRWTATLTAPSVIPCSAASSA